MATAIRPERTYGAQINPGWRRMTARDSGKRSAMWMYSAGEKAQLVRKRALNRYVVAASTYSPDVQNQVRQNATKTRVARSPGRRASTTAARAR